VHVHAIKTMRNISRVFDMKKSKCGCYFDNDILNIICVEHTYYELYGDYNGINEKLERALIT